MNLWKCDAEACDVTAVGVGGAIGLRAIGWYFQRGPVTLCPAHHPDPVPCHDPYSPDNAGQPCRLCRATDEADIIQKGLEMIKIEPVRQATNA